MKAWNYPAKSRADKHFILFATLLAFGLLFCLSSSAYAQPKAKGVQYQNFDPNGRLATLEQEAVEINAQNQASAKQPRMDKDMIIQIILQAAVAEGQDPSLVLAVAMAESRLDPSITSPRGAAGVMQLMPQTARRFGCRNLFDVYQNAACGARYLGFLLDRYDGNVSLALAAYNAGPAPVDRTYEIPRIGETQAFVQRVLQYMDEVRLELP